MSFKSEPVGHSACARRRIKNTKRGSPMKTARTCEDERDGGMRRQRAVETLVAINGQKSKLSRGFVSRGSGGKLYLRRKRKIINNEAVKGLKGGRAVRRAEGSERVLIT